MKLIFYAFLSFEDEAHSKAEGKVKQHESVCDGKNIKKVFARKRSQEAANIFFFDKNHDAKQNGKLFV